jgi:hypothetical protein
MGFFSGEKDDKASGNGVPVEGGKASAISAVGAHLQSKRGGARPGAGRPPKNPGGPAVGKTAEGKAVENQVEVSEADIEFVRTVAEAALKILARIEANHICGLINAIDDSYIREKTETYLRRCEIGPGDIEVVVNAAGAIAAKYSALSRYAPEMALASWACIHGMAFTGVTSDLKKLAVVVRAAKAKGVTNDTSNTSSSA